VPPPRRTRHLGHPQLVLLQAVRDLANVEGHGARGAGGHDEFLRGAAGAIEFDQVNLHLLVRGQRGEDGGENGGGSLVGRRHDAVVHPLALAARGDNAGVAQVGQMAGDLGLAMTENFDKEADADFAAAHEVEQAQACGVGQRRKEGGESCRFGTACHEFIIEANYMRVDKYDGV
jgi:hypothetical protein